MQSLSGYFRIGCKAAKLLLAVMVGGLLLSVVAPKDWGLLVEASQLLMMFCSGMLASQHAAIWEHETAEATSSPSLPSSGGKTL